MDKRHTIKFYHDQGLAPADIFKSVKKHGITRDMIYRNINRLKDIGSITDRKRSGRRRSVRTPAAIKRLRSRIWRNPQQAQSSLARGLGVSKTSINRMLKKGLRLKPFKKRRAQGLSIEQKRKRLHRSKALLERHAGENLEKIIFSDEKLFSVEESFNNQNVGVYAASFQDIQEELRTVQRFQSEKKS